MAVPKTRGVGRRRFITDAAAGAAIVAHENTKKRLSESHDQVADVTRRLAQRVFVVALQPARVTDARHDRRIERARADVGGARRLEQPAESQRVHQTGVGGGVRAVTLEHTQQSDHRVRTVRILVWFALDSGRGPRDGPDHAGGADR